MEKIFAMGRDRKPMIKNISKTASSLLGLLLGSLILHAAEQNDPAIIPVNLQNADQSKKCVSLYPEKKNGVYKYFFQVDDQNKYFSAKNTTDGIYIDREWIGVKQDNRAEVCFFFKVGYPIKNAKLSFSETRGTYRYTTAYIANNGRWELIYDGKASTEGKDGGMHDVTVPSEKLDLILKGKEEALFKFIISRGEKYFSGIGKHGEQPFFEAQIDISGISAYIQDIEADKLVYSPGETITVSSDIVSFTPGNEIDYEVIFVKNGKMYKKTQHLILQNIGKNKVSLQVPNELPYAGAYEIRGSVIKNGKVIYNYSGDKYIQILN